MQAEEVQDSKFTVHMQLSASKLDKKDFFGKVSHLSMIMVIVDVAITFSIHPTHL